MVLASRLRKHEWKAGPLVKIEILFVDGTTEVTPECDSVKIHEGVLHAYWIGYNSTLGSSDHIGSWPLVNIKKWVKRP